MNHFVNEHSIVREIWGNSDTILLIFAGASAEFALNKAVDWLYFTGKLPKAPLDRLFSTVVYAKMIVFAKTIHAEKAIATINAIHQGVEKKRGASIPNWAYKDVLFMLIDYSIRAYEILERKLHTQEREDVFKVFLNVGTLMHIKDLPQTYETYKVMRHEHIKANLENSQLTEDLYRQYKKHLGIVRFKLLVESQILITPKAVNQLLGYRKVSFLKPMISLYKLSRLLQVDGLVKTLLLPQHYKTQIQSLNQTQSKPVNHYFFILIL